MVRNEYDERLSDLSLLMKQCSYQLMSSLLFFSQLNLLSRIRNLFFFELLPRIHLAICIRLSSISRSQSNTTILDNVPRDISNSQCMIIHSCLRWSSDVSWMTRTLRQLNESILMFGENLRIHCFSSLTYLSQKSHTNYQIKLTYYSL